MKRVRAKDPLPMARKHSNHKRKKGTFALALLVPLTLALAGGVYFVVPTITSTTYNENEATTTPKAELPTQEVASHLPTPEPLKAIYMSACVVGTPSFREDLVALIDDTELNAVVIDIKDYTGKISFPSQNPLLVDSVSDACGANDMRTFIKYLHEREIYVIGRITVFQDPFYAKRNPHESVQSASRPGEPWKDYKGLSFVSVASRPFWEYIVALSLESYAMGFDELNYDYIRWPSDGPMSDIVYPGGQRAEELEKFFEHLARAVKPAGAVLSADLFGMTTTNSDDLNIGQVLERALPYFDYIAPMVYPSHYPKSFLGLGNPNLDPYRVVHYSMGEAVKRAVATTTTVEAFTHTLISTSTTPYTYEKNSYSPLKLRPWLQDFDYGGNYDIAEVKAQIQATYDAGLTSWMLWAPSNRYTKGALVPSKDVATESPVTP